MPLVISLVGGGGKTSCMFRLSEELKGLKKKILVTTTTRIEEPEANFYDHLKLWRDNKTIRIHSDDFLPGTITVTACEKYEGKLIGLKLEQLNTILDMEIFDVVLIEADGARRKPIKAPGMHEPIITERTRILIGVTGFDSFDKPTLPETVHRTELFTELTGKKNMDLIDPETLFLLISGLGGLFKSAPDNCRKIWLINKVDTHKDLKRANEYGVYVLERYKALDSVLIGSLFATDPIKLVLEGDRYEPF